MMKVIIYFVFIFVAVSPDKLDDLEKSVLSLQSQLIELKGILNEEIENNKKNNVGDCGDDWISYSDTKCFKVLKIKGSEVEAKGNCSQLDKSSTLITIDSQSEQQFVTKLMSNYSSDSVSVWIGLEYVNKDYKWMDGRDKKFENWDENAVKDGINKCVQMSLETPNLGKWTDDNCNKKYLIACQKNQLSKAVLQKQINNLTETMVSMKKDDNDMKNEIVSMKSELVPLNFIYTQLPDQLSPEQLWPKLQWQDVTQQYAGLFFRAEGGGSERFGTTQASNQSHIFGMSVVTAEGGTGGRSIWGDIVKLNQSAWTFQELYVPHALIYAIRVYTTGGELRPKNTAIKMWKRV